MADIQDLLRQREELERQIRQMQDSTRQDAIAQIRQLMSEHGLSVDDLGGGAPARKRGAGAGAAAGTPARGKPRGPVAPKYRDPETGKTWTGRGLRPRWVTAALDSGKTLQDLAITG